MAHALAHILCVPWMRHAGALLNVFVCLVCAAQTLRSNEFAQIAELIRTVVHEDAKFLKGALNMRNQRCFAVKVRTVTALLSGALMLMFNRP